MRDGRGESSQTHHLLGLYGLDHRSDPTQRERVIGVGIRIVEQRQEPLVVGIGSQTQRRFDEPVLGSSKPPPAALEVEYRSSFGAQHCGEDRKSTRLNSSHVKISYAVFCLK